MNKHAYLILAHNEHKLFKLLVQCLDDERNDIFVHIDKKAKVEDFNCNLKKSNIYFLEDRVDASWGDFSLVEAELKLFKQASTRYEYAYYHLISGVDLPIKNQDYIHSYCELHQGTEFIGFAQNVTSKELQWRSQHYFLFSKEFKSCSFFKRTVRALFARLQTLIGYRRSNLTIKKGAQWCSITHKFVLYILANERAIRKTFNHTYCPDELFIQTLCWNSDFKNNVYSLEDEFVGCKRYIKWVDGELKPILNGDILNMRNSSCWFARKFDANNVKLIKDFI